MTRDEIIQKLASMNPMRDDDSGTVCCFFCGAWETINRYSETIDHERDCIWIAAKQIVDAQ